MINSTHLLIATNRPSQMPALRPSPSFSMKPQSSSSCLYLYASVTDGAIKVGL